MGILRNVPWWTKCMRPWWTSKCFYPICHFHKNRYKKGNKKRKKREKKKGEKYIGREERGNGQRTFETSHGGRSARDPDGLSNVFTPHVISTKTGTKKGIKKAKKENKKRRKKENKVGETGRRERGEYHRNALWTKCMRPCWTFKYFYPTCHFHKNREKKRKKKGRKKEKKREGRRRDSDGHVISTKQVNKKRTKGQKNKRETKRKY
jgi:hypothetical protein